MPVWCPFQIIAHSLPAEPTVDWLLNNTRLHQQHWTRQIGQEVTCGNWLSSRQKTQQEILGRDAWETPSLKGETHGHSFSSVSYHFCQSPHCKFMAPLDQLMGWPKGPPHQILCSNERSQLLQLQWNPLKTKSESESEYLVTCLQLFAKFCLQNGRDLQEQCFLTGICVKE